MATQATSSPQLLDLLFEKAGVGLCLVAPDGRVLRANAEWLRSTPYSAEQVIGGDAVALLPGPRDQALTVRARALAGQRVELARWAHTMNGRETWWEGSVEPVPMEGGTGLLVMAHEVAPERRAASMTRGAAEELRACRERFRAFFDSAAVGIAELALDGHFIAANERMCRLTGYSRAELLRMTPADLTHPKDRRKEEARLSAHLRGESPTYEAEKRYVRKDGAVIWVQVSAVMHRDESGRRARSAAIVQDITERKRAEEALRLSEERLRSLGDNLPNGAIYRYQHDKDGRPRFLFISRGIERVIGVSPEEIVRDASAVLDTVLPEDRAYLDREEVRSREALAPFEVEVRLRCRGTHEVRWALLRSVPQRLPGGVTVWDGVCVDITARKQAEEALRGNEERLRAAFAASPDAININRLRDGAYVAVNERFEQLSLWPRAEVMGKTVVDLNVWVDLEERDRLMTRLLTASGGSIQNAETAFRRRDGSVFDASISAQMFEVNGERFLLAVTRDISNLKRAEQALRDADRRKDEFLGMLSHELRNPLAPVRHSLYILDHTDPAGEQARRAREVANRQVAHMAHLVDDLLDVTRVARGKIELRRSDLDLVALARRAAEDYREVMQDRGLDLIVDLPVEPLFVSGDETRLSQALGNLLANAAKFTPTGGRVTLTLRGEEGRAVAQVRDTGVGIAPEVLHRLFEPFTQASQTLARSEGGLGLGLALVRGLVEMHGGSVSAASEGPGKGATFTVILPLDVTAVQAVPAQPVLGGTASPRRVLVIDDNHDAANILREVLELDHHVVEVAYGARAGIEKARTLRPDVVLCDIGLPDMDGYEVARAMRADPDLGHVKLVAVSGYAQPEDVAMSKDAGFDAHLAKPPSIEAINRAIAGVGREGEAAPFPHGDAGAAAGA
jgi:PAS domain S-box-containing protein